MKAVLFTILILVILAGICAVTCPDREDHVNALENALQRTIDKGLSETSDYKDDPFSAALGSVFMSSFGGAIIDNILMVDNYFICSIGTVSYGGETKVVSVGIFNHVFTAEENKLAEEAVEAFQ